jgi:prevent-host-death family protein
VLHLQQPCALLAPDVHRAPSAGVDLVHDLVYHRRMDVGVHEAKTHLSKLLRRVAMGEEITIRNGGRPVARLVPPREQPSRQFGLDRGAFEVPEDFNAPLPDELAEEFES